MYLLPYIEMTPVYNQLVETLRDGQSVDPKDPLNTNSWQYQTGWPSAKNPANQKIPVFLCPSYTGGLGATLGSAVLPPVGDPTYNPYNFTPASPGQKFVPASYDFLPPRWGRQRQRP